MRVIRFSPALALLFAAAPGAALDGALEINQDCALAGCFTGDAPGFPVTIEAPGSYVLTSRLTVETLVAGIEIKAGPVLLDLGGQLIDGGGRCNGNLASCTTAGAGSFGIVIAPAATGARPRVVHVRNGFIRGFRNRGIDGYLLGEGSLFEDLMISETTSPSGAGISFDSVQENLVTLRRVRLVANAGDGLKVLPFGVAQVEDSLAFRNGGAGLRIGNGSVVRGSRLQNNIGPGVTLDDPLGQCVVADNVFGGNNSADTSEVPPPQYVLPCSAATVQGNFCLAGGCP